MIVSFTIVLEEDFEFVCSEILEKARRDRSIVIDTAPGVTLYFAGDGSVADLGLTTGLACLRLLDATRTLQAETEGYELSAADLEVFLRWLLETFPVAHVFDDETGEDLTELAELEVENLFVAEEYFFE